MQPVVRLDGSSSQLRALVLGKLATVNAQHRPPVLRPSPLVVLDYATAAAALKGVPSYFAEDAKTVRLGDPAGAELIASLGMDPGMLPRSLGGALSDEVAEISLERGLPGLSLLLEGSIVLPTIATHRPAPQASRSRALTRSSAYAGPWQFSSSPN